MNNKEQTNISSNYISNLSIPKQGISRFSLVAITLSNLFKRSSIIMTGCRNNNITIGKVKRGSKIRLKIKSEAVNNKIIIEDGFSGHVNLKIVGNNNTIFIGSNTILDHVSISLLQCNSSILIGRDVSMGKGRIYLSEGSGQYSSIFTGKASVALNNQPINKGVNVIIGDDSMISSGVMIMSSDGHPIFNQNDEKISSFGDVLIGKHVWIGTDVKVLKNTKIGAGSIIGMGSVITKDIPNNSIAAGNPCKVIRSNFGFWSRSVSERNIHTAKQVLLIK